MAPVGARRPSGSSTCSWPARPASSSCSTTSRSSRSSTAEAIPAELVEGQAVRLHQAGTPKLLGAASSSSPSTASAGRGSPSCCRNLANGRRRHRDRQLDDDRRVQPRARRRFFMNTGHQCSAGRASARGSPTASAARSQRPARLRRAALRREQPARRQVVLGQRLPADASTRACSSAAAATPVLYPLQPRRRRRATCSATSLDAHQRRSTGCGCPSVGDPEIATRIASYEMAYPHADQRPRS